MSRVDYKLDPVVSKPTRRYRKGSKYDPILDDFLAQDNSLVEVVVKGKEANYMRTQLKKRIEARDLKIDVSVVNNKIYLEK